MSDDLASAIRQAIEMRTSEMNTSVPGTVISYDPKTNRAIVRPSLPKKLANGKELEAPQIVSVPVVFPTSGMGGKQAAMTFPIGPGDGVMLSFQQRSIEDWNSGKNSAPTDPRQYDLSDCVATPGLNASGVAGNGTDVVLRMDKASIVMKPDNTITFGNENASFTISPSGDVSLKAKSFDITAASFTSKA